MIRDSYVLLTRIPIFLGRDGGYTADRLWAKDLENHLLYIEDFYLCCPIGSNPPKDAVPITVRPEKVHQVSEDLGWWSVLGNIIPNLRAVRKAIKGKEIVHGSAAGWAFPLVYYVLLLPRTFKLVMVVESSPWIATKSNAHFTTRLAEPVHTFLVKALLKRADARIFTQRWYRDALLGSSERSLVAPAVWIDDETVLESLPERPDSVLSLIFPSRMVPEKGVLTVLTAVSTYNGPPIRLDFVGDGPLTQNIQHFIQEYSGPVQMHYQPAIPYDAGFFDLLRRYDAVVIAALTEEQPRIAFDAFSQGLPCIASATNGNMSVITNGTTGFHFADGSALSALLAQLSTNLSWLPPMRSAALAYARNNSMRAMHQKREQFFHDTLAL